MFYDKRKVTILLFISDVVDVISPNVLVVVPIAEVIYIAEVPVVRSQSEVPCAKHILRVGAT